MTTFSVKSHSCEWCEAKDDLIEGTTGHGKKLLVSGWFEGRRFLRHRRKQPAGPILEILLGKVKREPEGRRVSARPLIATNGRKRSWALVLFKEGPNEPPYSPPRNPEFTEPLDDPVEDEEGTADGPLEDSEGKANG